MPALDLEAVRQAAEESQLHEIYFNQTSRVVSFAQSPDDPQAINRLNVYYTTGTVATCLDHPWQGKTQLFRRDVSMSLLRQLMREPRLHTGTGYHRRNVRARRDPCVVCLDKQPHVTLVCGHTPICRGCADQLPRASDGLVRCPVCRTASSIGEDATAPADEEAEALAQVSRLRDQARDLAEQTQQAEAVLAAFRARREERQRREAEERRRREEARRAEEARQAEEARRTALHETRRSRGNRINFFLSHADDVADMFTDTTKCVSTNGSATIFLYENGSWAWTAGLPGQLYNKLKGRSRSLPSPTYVAIGTGNRYYIEFADGQAQWSSPDDMNKYIRREAEKNGGIASVAFGEDYDTYFIVYKNGFWVGSGDIPSGLWDIISRRNRKGDLKCVSLGSNGQWFLEANNGRAWWGGLSTKTLRKIAKVKARIKFLDFGTFNVDENEDLFLVRYT